MGTMNRAAGAWFMAAGAWLMVAAGVAMGADGRVVGTNAADLLAIYPGLHMVETTGRIESFHGVPMNVAATPLQAATEWLAANGTAFGAGRLELKLVREEAMEDRFHVYTYSQTIDSVPVEFGMVKILVLSRPEGHAVVMASAKVATRPAAGFADPRLTGEEAQKAVGSKREYSRIKQWSAPEMIVYVGEGDFPEWIAPRLVWRFTGEQAGLGAPFKRSFFVDAATGELIHSRNEIYHIDVTGTVRGRATPFPPGSATADHAGNPPVEVPIPNIRVRINGDNAASAFTDINGNFTIPWAGTEPVTVDCSVGDGRWVTVQEQLAGQALMTASATATPGTPVTLRLNPAPGSQYTNAQVNAFLHQNSTHDFWKGYAPTSTILDTQLPAKTSVSGTCNAFYDGASTNYYAVGGSCNNTAFSSVVAHEYGHHIVNRLGLAQGGFGEGFGDVMSILQYDDFVVGRFFQTSGAPVRSPDTAMVQYPCSTCAVHTGGQVLGGSICKVRRNLGNRYGSAVGLEKARQNTISWSRVTLGGNSGDSALPRTLTEYLTVNDDDGNINNGTPDFCEIVNAFGQHGVTLEGINDSVTFALSQPIPSTLAPSSSTPFTVTIAGICRVPVADTARLHWRDGTSGAFNSTLLTRGVGNAYTGFIDAPSCAAGSIQYYFSVTTTNSTGGSPATAFFPAASPTAPAPVTALIASGSVVVADDFETDRGWTVGPNTATAGVWVRVDPNGTAAQPEDDRTPGGVNCWVTGQGTVGGALGAADIDGGATVLTSPAYNFASVQDVEVSYWRWYSNGLGAAPYADTFRIDVSVNNGTTWTNAETIGPGAAGDANVTPGWIQSRWTLRSKGLAPSSQIRLRFTAEDAGTGSLVEAALDDVQLLGLSCEDPQPCVGDFNGDGGVDGADVVAFFAAWEVGDSAADVSEDGGIDGSDLEVFFTAWQAGC
jgi:hypothetical protein